jgi:hypothetical protein
VRSGGADEMQGLFPEGYLFTVVLDGLGWVDQGLAAPARAPEAGERARALLAQAESAKGTDPFNPELDPPFGVFYQGWVLRLQVGVALLGEAPLGEARAAEREALRARCAAVAAAFDRSPTPFLPSYAGMSWPVDAVVAAANLPACDRLAGTDTRATQARWLRLAQARVDPATGLLPHTADPLTGAPTSKPRGSSLSIIARTLHELDPAWGLTHYEGLQRRFFVTRLGVPGVTEHEGGGGDGDIDAGPLVFGVSLSATVVSAGAARLYEDDAFADAVLDVGEIVGLPLTLGGEKRYAAGLLPVGDAFGAWSTAPVERGGPRPAARGAVPGPLWRLPWELGWGSLFLFLSRLLPLHLARAARGLSRSLRSPPPPP